MKKNALFFTLLLFTSSIYSQQWDGSQTFFNQINRYGNIAILPNTNGLPYVDIANNKITIKKLNETFPGTFLEITKDNIFFHY